VAWKVGKECGIKTLSIARYWWLTPVILATQEAKIRRITVQSQPGQIVHETLSQKTHHIKRSSGVTQSVGPGFKLRCHKNKNKKRPCANIYISYIKCKILHFANCRLMISSQPLPTNLQIIPCFNFSVSYIYY
jgi:hypothetical protein